MEKWTRSWPTPNVMATSGSRRLVPPEPPARLGAVSLTPKETPGAWFRLTPRRYDSPLFWSRSGTYRFDSPSAKWGVCYAANSITAAFQEVFGTKIRHGKAVDWPEIADISVWRIMTPQAFSALSLFGETLARIDATLQCFVSSYPLSQRWGAALMNHPADMDGLVYFGRRCGAQCVALFGDAAKPRRYQSALKTERLGDFVHWGDFWPLLDRLDVRISSLPSKLTARARWSEE